MRLSFNDSASYEVRAIASLKLEELRNWITAASSAKKQDDASRAHLFYAASRIAQFQKDPALFVPKEPPPGPDGPPIGGMECTGFMVP